MRKNLLIFSVLVLTLGFSFTVLAKGFHKMEEFSKLPQEKQQLLIETMKRMKESKSQFRVEMKVAKKEMYDAITAPEFDDVRYHESVERLQRLHEQRMDLMSEAVGEVASQFTQEEREILAKIFPKGKRGHGHHRKDCSK